jgi:hypothetical protein
MLRSALRHLTGTTPAQPKTPSSKEEGAYDEVPDTISSLGLPFLGKKAALETTAEVKKKPNFILLFINIPAQSAPWSPNIINNLAGNLDPAKIAYGAVN